MLYHYIYIFYLHIKSYIYINSHIISPETLLALTFPTNATARFGIKQPFSLQRNKQCTVSPINSAFRLPCWQSDKIYKLHSWTVANLAILDRNPSRENIASTTRSRSMLAAEPRHCSWRKAVVIASFSTCESTCKTWERMVERKICLQAVWKSRFNGCFLMLCALTWHRLHGWSADQVIEYIPTWTRTPTSMFITVKGALSVQVLSWIAQPTTLNRLKGVRTCSSPNLLKEYMQCTTKFRATKRLHVKWFIGFMIETHTVDPNWSFASLP